MNAWFHRQGLNL